MRQKKSSHDPPQEKVQQATLPTHLASPSSSDHSSRQIIESLEDYAVFTTDEQGIITSWNSGAERLFGFSSSEIMGRNVEIIFTEDDTKSNEPEKERVAAREKGRGKDERWHVRKDGTQFWVSGKIFPLKDERGMICGFTKICRDLTDRKKVQESEERFRTLIEQSTDAIQLVSPEGEILYSTDSIKNVLGYTPEELKGEVVTPFLHPDDTDYFFEKFSQLLKEPGGHITLEYRVKHKDGSWVWLETTGVNHLQTPTIQALVGTFRNITERKKAEEERQRLERQKDEFIGIASHELKTPVTSIKAYGQVLQATFSKKGDLKAVEQLRKMDAQINKLNNLIGDLLDVTKIQSGRLEFHEEYFDFNELVTEIIGELQLTSTKHEIVTKLGKTKSIFADRERIGQVLTNLITNAIKYSPHAKKIIVTTEYSRDEMTLCVQDYGVGIPKDKQEKVFEQFFRVSGPTESTFPGLGLGLYVSSEIIKREGGRIWVESNEGKGSTFCFCLPLKKNKQQAPRQEKNYLVNQEIQHE